MIDPAWFALFLGVVGVCVAILTVTIVKTAAELRRTLRDTRASLRRARRLVVKADRAATAVEAVVQQVCEVAIEAIDRFSRLRRRAQALWAGHVGNGAGVGPRSHHRSQ